jgi:diguanylate cyclase (GGDEF)-like protein
LIALFSSRYLSRQLGVLLNEMRELSVQKTIPEQLPKIEALVQSSSFEIRRLAVAILSFHQAMKDRDAEQDRSYQLAFHDHLTGLPNRAKMLEFIDQALLSRFQDSRKGGIIKLNINGLKVVNDGLGYDQGNRLLIEVGERLCMHFLSTSIIARSSSDEFVLLIRDMGSEAHADDVLMSVMRQIHHLFDEPFQLKQQQVFITVVLGAAIFPMTDKEDAEETFMHAMIALHAAKGLNTEQSLIYHPKLEDKAKQRVQVESALRHAITNDHLVLYFQPQVKSTGEIVSVETLVRWNDPEKGLIAPSLFIPMAEQSDLIIELDRWVLTHACQSLKQLQDAGSDMHVSVNISGRHFAKDFFVTSIMDIVNSSGINPHGLMLEVTEGIFIADLNDVVGKMRLLREQGIAFSIDDFGTGYSSLQYLKRLPIQELKIDKSFVDGLPTDAEDIALVKTIIGIAQNLELNIVVEGVETQAQIDLLNSLGSFVMQGYFYAKPQPAQAVIQQILFQP